MLQGSPENLPRIDFGMISPGLISGDRDEGLSANVSSALQFGKPAAT